MVPEKTAQTKDHFPVFTPFKWTLEMRFFLLFFLIPEQPQKLGRLLSGFIPLFYPEKPMWQLFYPVPAEKEGHTHTQERI